MAARRRIGFAAPLSGPQAMVGVPMLRVVELALSDRRAENLNLEVIALDDEADDSLAAQVAQRFAEDDSVVAVIGHKNSGPSLAAAPFYHAAGLTQLTQSSTDSALTRNGWDNLFRLCADNERQAAVAAEFAAGQLDCQGFVAIHDRTAYGRPLAEAFSARLEDLGFQPAAILEMNVGQEDFADVVGAIARTAARLIYMGATEVEGGKLTAALGRAGVIAQVMTAEGGPFSPFGSIAGPAGEGSIHTYAGSDPRATAESRSITERCIALIGEAPSFVVECHDAVSVLASALARGARTRNEVRRQVADTDLQGLTGRIRFTAGGERESAPVSLWRIENGRPTPLGAVGAD